MIPGGSMPAATIAHMDQASGGTPEPGGPPDPNAAPHGAPANGPPTTPSLPSSSETGTGLQMEPCYRHPSQFTGVHCTRCGRPICVDCMRPAAVGYQCPDCLATERSSGYRYQRGVATRSTVTPVTRAILTITIAMFVLELVTGATQLLGFGGDPLKLIRLGAEFPPLTAGIARLTSSGQLIRAHTPE